MHRRLLSSLALGGALCAPPAVAADAIDLHAYWDSRCKSCHGDAGDFARRTLRVRNGMLEGTHHQGDLSLFLRRHYLAADLVTPVHDMLMAQAATAPIFKTQCAGCHGPASAFARQSLQWRDGVPVGKLSGRPVSDYLRTHGGLAATEVPAMAATLARVLTEVSGPVK